MHVTINSVRCQVNCTMGSRLGAISVISLRLMPALYLTVVKNPEYHHRTEQKIRGHVLLVRGLPKELYMLCWPAFHRLVRLSLLIFSAQLRFEIDDHEHRHVP